MDQAPARVLNEGKVTIPAHLRHNLGIDKGDYVMLSVEPLEGDET